jgi:predicted membrane-bound spermidine synthase
MDKGSSQTLTKRQVASARTETGNMLTQGGLGKIGMGLFFASAGFLMLEISLTRIFSVVMWYHFAFLTISVALFGFALSGFVVHLLPGVFRAERVVKAAFAASAVMAIAVPVCFKLFSINPAQAFLTGFLKKTQEGGLSAATLLLIAALYLSAVVPFFVGGLVGANLFRHFGSRASRIYFFDLTGAGLGCALTIPVLNWFGGPGTMGVVAVLASLGAFCFSLAVEGRTRKILSAVLLLLAIALTLSNSHTGYLHLKYYRGREQRDIEYERWNSFSRVAVMPMESPDSLLIEIDAASNTVVTRWDGRKESIADLRYSLIAAQYSLVDGAKVLSIGSGGGIDILTAITCGATEITAVEVNRIIVDLMMDRYSDFSGSVYRAPGVHVVNDEARSYIRRSNERYDVIQAGYVDTYAATAAGAFALTENTLYTREAFEDYLSHLTDDGIISFQRYYEEKAQQSIRLVSVAIAALRNLGEEDPSRHIAVIRSGRRASVLVKKTRFTEPEIERLTEYCNIAGIEMVAAPGMYGGDIYGELLGSADPESVINEYELDISATTDDRPFFFYTIRPVDFWSGLFFTSGEFQHSRAVFLLTSLLIVVAALSFIALFIPLLLQRRLFNVRSIPSMAYFAVLGLGFMMVEIGVLQRLMLYLGHPTLALSVVLCTILISAGLGSAATGRIENKDTGSRLRLLLVIVLLGIGFTAFVWPPIFRSLIGLTRAARITIGIALLAPVGFVLGTAFPLGIRRMAAARAELIPWAWGMNAIASVLGSVLAMVVAINNGFTVTLLAGAACYAAAFWLAPRTGRV